MFAVEDRVKRASKTRTTAEVIQAQRAGAEAEMRMVASYEAQRYGVMPQGENEGARDYAARVDREKSAAVCAELKSMAANLDSKGFHVNPGMKRLARAAK